jgi:SNF2 family DNA or RNA helicase
MPRQGRLDFYSFDYRGRLPIVDAATVIIDEAHYLRHLEIVRATRWAYLNTANNLWLLTGSPVVGSKDDLENLYTFLGVRDCMLRRTVKDVDLELPQRVYDTIPVDLPHDLYHVLSILDEEWKEIPSTKLPGIDRFSEARVQLTRAKCTAMFEWVAKYAQHSRCVVYSMYLDPLKLLVASRSDWALVTGEMNVNERDAVIAAFDKGLYRGLACSLTAVGVGVSLAAAERILFVDRSWNPGENEQVERRVCRIGNTSERVYVTDLVAAHPLEERVYEVLRAKQVDIDLVDYMR